jgi:hypothetical protein
MKPSGKTKIMHAPCCGVHEEGEENMSRAPHASHVIMSDSILVQPLLAQLTGLTTWKGNLLSAINEKALRCFSRNVQPNNYSSFRFPIQVKKTELENRVPQNWKIIYTQAPHNERNLCQCRTYRSFSHISNWSIKTKSRQTSPLF